MRLRRAGGTPLPRRRPQVGPGLAGRGTPDRSGLGPAGRGDKCAELECSPQHRGEAGRSPSLRDRHSGAAWLPPPRVTCSRSWCQQPPAAAAAAAASRPLLPAPRCAPPPAPPSRPGPPDADLAPPQPCGPEGAGPLCSRARPPGYPVFPLAATDPPSIHPAPLHPPCSYVTGPPCPRPPPCAGSLILKPQVDPFLSPIGPSQLQPLV